jgi:hypothetical protein
MHTDLPRHFLITLCGVLFLINPQNVFGPEGLLDVGILFVAADCRSLYFLDVDCALLILCLFEPLRQCLFEN